MMAPRKHKARKKSSPDLAGPARRSAPAIITQTAPHLAEAPSSLFSHPDGRLDPSVAGAALDSTSRLDASGWGPAPGTPHSAIPRLESSSAATDSDDGDSLAELPTDVQDSKQIGSEQTGQTELDNENKSRGTDDSVDAEDDDDDDTFEDEDEDETGDDIPGNSLPNTDHLRLPRSLSAHHLATTLAPPFYNRPPTPLPPSPSLTSLLRPTFSSATTPSHPATPDESETDTALTPAATDDTYGPGTATTNGDASSIATSWRSPRTPTPAVARARPQVPTYEYYGFLLYVTSSLCFLLYLLWAYLPAPFLYQLGINYYPNRWWALALPAWLVVAITYIYVALALYNTEILTPPINSLAHLVDVVGQIGTLDAHGRILRPARTNAVSPSLSSRVTTSATSHLHAAQQSAKDIPNLSPGTEPTLSTTDSAQQSESPSGIAINTSEHLGTLGNESLTAARATRRHQRHAHIEAQSSPTVHSHAPTDPRDRLLHSWSQGTDAVLDVPIGAVCEILYGAES